MQTITTEQLHDRLTMLRATRIQHANDTGYPRPQEHHEYHTADGERSFKHEDDARYYEALTGHIEEVQFLLALAGAV